MLSLNCNSLLNRTNGLCLSSTYLHSQQSFYSLIVSSWSTPQLPAAPPTWLSAPFSLRTHYCFLSSSSKFIARYL